MTAEDADVSGAAAVDASAAMVRAESAHLDWRLKNLATRLSSIPGLDVKVSYRHGRLRRLLGDLPYINDLNRRTGPIQRIVAVVDAKSYWLESNERSLRCGREASSGETGQMNEELPFAVWARALFDDIAQQNFVNHDSMVALRRLVEHDLLD